MIEFEDESYVRESEFVQVEEPAHFVTEGESETKEFPMLEDLSTIAATS